MTGFPSEGVPKGIGPREAAQSEVWQSGRMRRIPNPVCPCRSSWVRIPPPPPCSSGFARFLGLASPIFATANSRPGEKGGSCVAGSPVVTG